MKVVPSPFAWDSCLSFLTACFADSALLSFLIRALSVLLGPIPMFVGKELVSRQWSFVGGEFLPISWID